VYHGDNDCNKSSQKRYENWAGGLIIHKCPKCGCQVEKDAGCPNMNCAICSHYWCWSCGFSTENSWHEYLEKFCEKYNNMINEKRIPGLTIQAIILLLIILTPIIVVLGSIFLGSKASFVFTDRHMRRRLTWIPVFIALPLWFVWLALFIVLAVTISAVTIVVAIVPFTLISLYFLTVVSFRWNLQSRKVKLSENQKQIIEEGTKRMAEEREGN
jgi:hypothetical protein